MKEMILKMTLEHKIGQLFLLAFPGKDPEIIRPLVERYGIGGCYISQDNAETFKEAEKLSRTLQGMSRTVGSGLPMLLGVDQEGAWGVLVPESRTGPGNLALGAGAKKENIGDIYKVFSREMQSVGYNLLLGPCADINTDPHSPIIGTRSFGEFPRQVSDCVAAAVHGAASHGMLTTLKHFPGHGSTSVDTHREIPMVDKSLDELLETDLVPFFSGIEAGANMVMTSHILYPQIDPVNPATLSKVILQELLRKRMNFQGVILSDSMNMGAIRKVYDPAESTLAAFQAGVDVVMLSEEHYDHSDSYLDKQIASIEAMIQAVRNGHISETAIDEKLLRVLMIKGLLKYTQVNRLSEVEISQHRKIQSRVAAQGLTLVQKNHWPLPDSGKLVCINATPRKSYSNITNSRGIGPNQEEPAYDAFCRTLRELDKTVVFLEFEDLDSQDFENKISNMLKSAQSIIVVTEDYPLPGEDFEVEEQQKLVRRMAREYSDKLVILGLRSSYELTEYPPDVTYICGYSSRTCTAEEAGRLIALRETELPGTPPVTLRP